MVPSASSPGQEPADSIATGPATVESKTIKNVFNHVQASDIGSINYSIDGAGASVTITNNHMFVGPSDSITKTEASNCIPPVSTFTGRVTELEKLKELLTKHGVVVLAGMGGMGKTQLARRLAQDSENNTRTYWLAAETPDILKRSVWRLAKEFRVETRNGGDNRDANVILKELYGKLTESMSLLIFDNVENQADVHAYLPQTLRFHIDVLITSRRTNWSGQNITVFTLKPILSTDALQLFRSIFGEDYQRTPVDQWSKIAEELGYLPLALQAAARHMKYFNRSISQCLTLLKKPVKKLYQHELEDYENKSIYTSLLLNLVKLEEQQDTQSQLMVKLLYVTGYLHPDSIVTRYLLPLVNSDNQEDDLNDACTILCDLSLLNTSDCKHYSMHRVMQTIIRCHQPAEAADNYYMLALQYALADCNGCIDDTVFRYANDRAEVVSQCYESYPTSNLLKGLARHGCSIALEKIFQKQNNPDKCKSIIDESKLLNETIRYNKIDIVELLLKFDANINQADERGSIPLHVACRGGNMAIIRLLLKYGADLMSTDRNGWTAAHWAVRSLKHVAAKCLFENNRSLINATDIRGNTPFQVISGYFYDSEETKVISLIDIFSKHDADITQICAGGHTVLHAAVTSALPKLVLFILELNKDILNIRDTEGRCPLHVIGDDRRNVTENDFITIIKILIQYGQCLEETDCQGRTVLHQAARIARPLLISHILELNRDVIEIRDTQGRTALHVIGESMGYYEAKDDIVSTIKLLMQHGQCLEETDCQGRTVLHHAARHARPMLISHILELNRDLVQIKDNHGRSPLHVIGDSWRYEKIGDELWTSIFHVNFEECARLLLDSGLLLEDRDIQGHTPLDTVRAKWKPVLRKLLVDANNQNI